MKDESLIEEMRAALRDGQDRAEARRRANPPGFPARPVDVIPAAGQRTAQTLRSRIGRLVGRDTSAR